MLQINQPLQEAYLLKEKLRLVFQFSSFKKKDGTWYTYGLDLTKNVCEVFSSAGYIATTYTYSPYGPFSFASRVVLFNYVMQIKITLRIF